MSVSGNLESNQSSLSILLAEDNPVNQKVAIRLLNHLGYQADIVANGHEVISAIAEKVYDVILMDVQMPHMNGIEATKHIRQDEEDLQRSPITIIALTANANEEDQDLCLTAGMNNYISKPIQIDKLKNILQRYSSAGF